MSTQPLILCRIPRSRRKYDYCMSAIGEKPQIYYSFRFVGNFVYLTNEQYERARKYVTRARVDETKLLKCWNGENVL